MNKIHPRYISRSLNIEYFEVPKVACTAIKKAILQSDGFCEKNNIIGDFVHSHTSFFYIPKNFVIEFSFTFIRHPLDRLVSLYVEKVLNKKTMKIGNIQRPSMDDMVNYIVNTGREEADKHHRPQSLLLKNKHIDFIGRYERIQEEWAVLMNHGLPPLTTMNKTKNKENFKLYFNKRNWQKAVQYYKKDFEVFNYDHQF